jgi:hypothetical protein
LWIFGRESSGGEEVKSEKSKNPNITILIPNYIPAPQNPE